MNATEVLERSHGIGELSRGAASAICASVEDERPAFILKNNSPYRVIVTMSDYEELEQAREQKSRLAALEWALGNSWDSVEEMLDHMAAYERVIAGAADRALSGKALESAALAILEG